MKLLSVIFLLLASLLAICNITAALPALAIQPAQAAQPIDCSNVLSTEGLNSGVKNIYPPGSPSHVQVFCESDGYTVILKRTGLVEFNKNFIDYRNGFGNAAGEYFIGLENLHLLTSSRNYELLVTLVEVNDVKITAHYNTFSVGPAVHNYPLSVSGFAGGLAGDIMAGRDGQKFSTINQDFSSGSCVQITQTPFWYSSCQSGNSHGFYVTDAQNQPHNVGLQTQNSRNNLQLKSFTMMIRPNPSP